MTHTFHITKGEDKEHPIIDDFSKDNVYLIREINNIAESKWCSIHNTKTHDTSECCIYLQRSKLQLNTTTVVMSISQRTAPYLTEIRKDLNLNTAKQNPSIHTTFSTNAQILWNTWININKQLTALKLSNFPEQTKERTQYIPQKTQKQTLKVPNWIYYIKLKT